MQKYGISFNLVIVKKINKKDYAYYNNYNNNISISELGCGLSHLWCLKDIIKNKYKNAIIFEDDIIFHKNFEARFFNIIQRQPYDFLLLGACDFHFKEINLKLIFKECGAIDIVPFKTKIDDLMISGEVYCAGPMSNNNIGIGTLYSGFYLINEQGVLLKSIDKEAGLKSEIINAFYEDQQKGLWLALDIGIARVEINSGFRSLNQNEVLQLISGYYDSDSNANTIDPFSNSLTHYWPLNSNLKDIIGGNDLISNIFIFFCLN
jgi:GR25 family glycosyltransferase involved in LPS biosynthesis